MSRRRRTLETGRGLLVAATLALLALGALPAGGAGEPAPALDVGVVAAALPLDDGTGELALPVVVELSARDGGEPAALADGELRLELRDADGRVRASLGQPYAVPPAESAGETTRGLRLYAELRVAPGSYTLQARATDERGATGSATAALRLPARGAEAWLASPALVVDRRPGFRVARATQPPAPELPFAFVGPDGAAYLPAASVELGATETIVAHALVAAPSRDFPFVVAEAIDTRDGQARRIPALVAGVAPTAYAGLLDVALELGPIGAAGEFRLRLGLADDDGGLASPVGAELSVVARAGAAPVAPAAASATAPAWPAAGGSVADRYRRLLFQLAEQGVEATAPELVRFESEARAAAGERRASSNALRDAERAVIGELESREARLPVAALHFAAAELYRVAREMALSAESLQGATELLESAARGAEPALRARIADLLALSRPSAALAVDPSHPLALLRVALGQERGRQFVAASQTLAQLLRAEPGNAEARLRAAVVLRRRGEAAAARDELERLVAAPAADWVLELGFSELATLEAALGRPDEAVRRLREGVARVESQLLHLQLACALDRANRWSEAIAVVNRLPVSGPDARASARHLYAREPVEETAAARARVAASIDAALPALRRELGSGAGGAGR